MRVEIETGTDADGRVYADLRRMGRHWTRLTSTGLRPFDSTDEARKYAREYAKRHR